MIQYIIGKIKNTHARVVLLYWHKPNIVKHNNEYTFIQNIDNIPRSFIRNIENYDFIHFLDKDNKIYIENDFFVVPLPKTVNKML